MSSPCENFASSICSAKGEDKTSSFHFSLSPFQLVGARGVVVRVCPDRDLLVRVGDTTWTLNRSVCTSIPEVVSRFGVATAGRRSPSANRDNCVGAARHRLYSHVGPGGDERHLSHHGESTKNALLRRKTAKKRGGVEVRKGNPCEWRGESGVYTCPLVDSVYPLSVWPRCFTRLWS